MTTFLFVRGMEVVELDESFNNTRHRINEALTNVKRDGTDIRDPHRPLHHSSFRTADGGRIAVVPEHILGVGSDEPKDGDED